MWTFKGVAWVNPFPHSGHSKGLWPVWVRTCCFRKSLLVKALSQYSQLYGFTPKNVTSYTCLLTLKSIIVPVWVFWCSFKLCRHLNSCPQMSQTWGFRLWCSDLTCRSWLIFRSNIFPHNGQGYSPVSPWTFSMCRFTCPKQYPNITVSLRNTIHKPLVKSLPQTKQIVRSFSFWWRLFTCCT